MSWHIQPIELYHPFAEIFARIGIAGDNCHTLIGQWGEVKRRLETLICLDVDIEVDRPCMMANDQNTHTLVYGWRQHN